ncbi:hypothetical protein SAMN05443575_1995 [Jatrophihabitans endophyticus]|uniref:Uncharacterized protein n=2 Tax=Jatrophihabitans endophyticus TaxID=1206085 RepID=A0A1M5IT06_9ACTN|nr:hypothetical protein SAMN05443575_1995 [Jatrophihabitans endophyticus]
MLGPGRTASAGLSWRAEPRDERIRELRIAATPADPAHVVPLDLLELRLTSRLDYYPWVSRPSDVFS